MIKYFSNGALDFQSEFDVSDVKWNGLIILYRLDNNKIRRAAFFLNDSLEGETINYENNDYSVFFE